MSQQPAGKVYRIWANPTECRSEKEKLDSRRLVCCPGLRTAIEQHFSAAAPSDPPRAIIDSTFFFLHEFRRDLVLEGEFLLRHLDFAVRPMLQRELGLRNAETLFPPG